MNIKEIKEVIKLIDESSLDEFTYETKDVKVKLKKAGSRQVDQTAVEVQKQIIQDQPVSAAAGNPAEAEAANEERQVEQRETIAYDYEIVSPMVGTFYAAPSPESDPFVAIGSKVQPGSVVCIVEAMKLFNEIEAEVTGEIVEILVENGELVEYGQPLFRVKSN